MTTDIQCEVKGCTRAPEAFRRPDGRVYVRSRCRAHRMAGTAKTAGKSLQTPRQPVAPTVTAPVALTGTHKPWRELKTKWWRKSVVAMKGGIWVKDEREGWFIPRKQVKSILAKESSTFEIAKETGLPSRVILSLISAVSKGRLHLT